MRERFIDRLELFWIHLVVSVIFIIVGLIFDWFFLLLLGIIGLLLCGLFLFADEESGAVGCLSGILIFLYIICAIFFHDIRYIASGNNKLHLYEDCSLIAPNDKVVKMRETEGFFYGRFSDCEVCEKRKHDENIRIRYEKIERKRQSLIKELQSYIDRLNNGEYPYDIEEELYEEYSREE